MFGLKLPNLFKRNDVKQSETDFGTGLPPIQEVRPKWRSPKKIMDEISLRGKEYEPHIKHKDPPKAKDK